MVTWRQWTAGEANGSDPEHDPEKTLICSDFTVMSPCYLGLVIVEMNHDKLQSWSQKGKESFRNVLDPDDDPDQQENRMDCSLDPRQAMK